MKVNIVGDIAILNGIEHLKMEDQLLDLFTRADFNIVDFEVPIHTKEQPIVKSGPVQSQCTEIIDWLKGHHFNVFTMSNNHIFDYGEKAYIQTRSQLEKIGNMVGSGDWKDAYTPLIIEKYGIKTAIISASEVQFVTLHDEWSQKNMMGCAWINHPSINRTIRDLKKQIDYVIVIVHAGLEAFNAPLPEWRSRYRELIDIGADVVVGGHTHVPAGMEVYKNKPIFYATGNFAYTEDGDTFEGWFDGYCVNLDLSKDGISYNVYGTKFDNSIIRLKDEKLFQNEFDHLNNLLSEDKYLQHVNDTCLRKLNDYYNLFSMGGIIRINRWLPKSILRFMLGRCSDMHLLNNLQCETHRWCIARALNLKNKTKY